MILDIYKKEDEIKRLILPLLAAINSTNANDDVDSLF